MGDALPVCISESNAHSRSDFDFLFSCNDSCSLSFRPCLFNIITDPYDDIKKLDLHYLLSRLETPIEQLKSFSRKAAEAYPRPITNLSVNAHGEKALVHESSLQGGSVRPAPPSPSLSGPDTSTNQVLPTIAVRLSLSVPGRVMFSAIIGRFSFMALLDTGSAVSLMSEDIFNMITEDGSVTFPDHDRPVLLQDLHGNTIKQAAKPKLIPIHIEGGDYIHPFYVASNDLQGTMLIGLGFLEDNGLSLQNMKNGRFRLVSTGEFTSASTVRTNSSCRHDVQTTDQPLMETPVQVAHTFVSEPCHEVQHVIAAEEITIDPFQSVSVPIRRLAACFPLGSTHDVNFHLQELNTLGPIQIVVPILDAQSSEIELFNRSTEEITLGRNQFLARAIEMDAHGDTVPIPARILNIAHTAQTQDCAGASLEEDMLDDLPDPLMDKIDASLGSLPLPDDLEPFDIHKNITTQSTFPQHLRQTFYDFLTGPVNGVISTNEYDFGEANCDPVDIPVNCEEPVISKPYSLPHLRAQQMDKILNRMIDQGIIRPGDSSATWSAPAFLIGRKGEKGGPMKCRFLIDYRRLNRHTVKSAYPIPHINRILHQLKQMDYYTVIDLRSEF